MKEAYCYMDLAFCSSATNIHDKGQQEALLLRCLANVVDVWFKVVIISTTVRRAQVINIDSMGLNE